MLVYMLIARFRVSSDHNGAFRQSRSDGRIAGSLPVLVGKSPAATCMHLASVTIRTWLPVWHSNYTHIMLSAHTS